jgi:hypothetical protein
MRATPYVILLVVQKLPEPLRPAPKAIIVRAQDLVGQALQDALEGRTIESPYYSIHEVGQEAFVDNAWLVLPPQSAAIQKKFGEFAELQSFTQLRQGIITVLTTYFSSRAEMCLNMRPPFTFHFWLIETWKPMRFQRPTREASFTLILMGKRWMKATCGASFQRRGNIS